MSRFLRSWWNGLTLTSRRLAAHPGVSGVVVVTLALGVGVIAAVFSVVHPVLLEALPFEDPDRLVMVWEDHSRAGGREHVTVAPPTLDDLKSRSRSLDDFAAQWSQPYALTTEHGAQSVTGARVSPDYFRVLGVPATLGRGFPEGDVRPETENTVVLSHGLWERQYGADPDVLGRVLTLDGRGYTVIGVMPRTFRVPVFFTAPADTVELWVPLVIPPGANVRLARALQVVARMAPGVGLERVRTEVDTLMAAIAREHPDTNEGIEGTVVPLREQIVGDVQQPLTALLLSALLVLLVACANIAGLLVARGLTRRHEMAVRAALGADGGRLLRQVLGEGLLMAAVGGLAGLGLAAAGVRWLGGILPADLPRVAGVGVDGVVLGFAVVVSLIAGSLFSIAPALRARRPDLVTDLRDGSRSGEGEGPARLRTALVAVQMALSLGLLVTTGLMLSSLIYLQSIDLGFDSRQVLTFKVVLPDSRYPDVPARQRLFDDVFDGLRSQPRVAAVGAIHRLPLDPAWGSAALILEGRPSNDETRPVVGVRIVAPGYFDALSIPLRTGRRLEERDTADQPPVALVNQAFAERFFPRTDVVGRRIALGTPGPPWLQVVGVVGNTAYDSLVSQAEPEVYLPRLQAPTDWFQVVVRTRGAPLDMVDAVRSALRELDPELPIVDLRRLDDQVDAALARPRLTLTLLTVFALLTVLLATLGVFALTTHSVTRRSHEMAIRMALGADRRAVLRLLMRRLLLLLAACLPAGLAAGVGLGRILATQLHGVEPYDPWILCVSGLVVAATVLTAGWAAARKVVNLQPADALRVG